MQRRIENPYAEGVCTAVNVRHNNGAVCGQGVDTTTTQTITAKARRRRSKVKAKFATSGLMYLMISSSADYLVSGFSLNSIFKGYPSNGLPQHRLSVSPSPYRLKIGPIPLFLIPPPGSGYTRPDDDVYQSELPSTYEPMMAYPGTMRPGKTPENQPFQDLPIGDNDPEPVPWPHFQQIEWHHRWSEPPHEHPGTMENFIAAQGRWATPEQEAEMRAGARRDFRQRQEREESEKRESIITDDDDDDDEDDTDAFTEKVDPVALGEGMFGRLGSDADRAITAAAVSPDAQRDREEETVDKFIDEGLDDFLLDLGLDSEIGQNEVGDVDDEEDTDEGPLNSGNDGVSATINVDDEEDELSQLGLDDEDEVDTDDAGTVPLDDFTDNESLDTEDIFGEGGFDFDDGDFGDAGDDAW